MFHLFLYFLLSLRFMFTNSFYTITLMPLYLFFHMEDKIEKARKVWIKWLPTYHALTCLMPACMPCPDFMLMIWIYHRAANKKYCWYKWKRTGEEQMPLPLFVLECCRLLWSPIIHGNWVLGLSGRTQLLLPPCFARGVLVGTRPLAFWTTAAIFSGERTYPPSSSNFANV